MRRLIKIGRLDTLSVVVLVVALAWAFWQMATNLAPIDAGHATDGTAIVAQATVTASGYPAPESTLTSLPQPTLVPLPTLLPESGLQRESLVELTGLADFVLLPSASPRFIRPATDGSTLVGVVVESTDARFAGHLQTVDLHSGVTQRIADLDDVTYPQISEQYIVWTDKAGLNFLDRNTGKIGQVQIGELARNPSLSGSLVVWEYVEYLSRPGQRGLWAYDLATGSGFLAVAGAASRPLISGRWIVYENWDKADAASVGLYVTNLDTLESFEIGRRHWAISEHVSPSLYAIASPWIVWSTNSEAEPQLQFYNLLTRTKSIVRIPSCSLSKTITGKPEHLTLSGDTVLFRGCFQSMAYSISSGRFFALPIDDRAANAPAAFVGWAFAKDKLVWISISDERERSRTRVLAAIVRTEERADRPVPSPTASPVLKSPEVVLAPSPSLVSSAPSESVNSPVAAPGTAPATPYPPSYLALVRTEGILYVRQESHDPKRGLSIALGGGHFRPLTTVFEIWIDAQSPWRFLDVGSELLEDGPHIFIAAGSDGETGWWRVDPTKGQIEPERHPGRHPWYDDLHLTLADWVNSWANEGTRWIKRAAEGKVRQTHQSEQAPWGQLISFTLTDAGYVTTATVRAEAPHLLVEKITVDPAGNLHKSFRITHWEWLEPAQFDADFWLNPPRGIPIGPGNLKP